MHFSDRAESDIWFVVQIKADVRRDKAESNISFNQHNISVSINTTNRTPGEALSNKCFIMPQALNDHKKKSFFTIKIFNC